MNIQLRREAGILEKSFVVVALLLFANPFTAMLPPENNGIIELITFYSIYIITFFIIRNNIKDVLILAKRERFLICLLVITFLSTIWSDFPLITLRRSVALAGTYLFGMYLAERYTLKEQLHMLGTMLGITAILSLLFVLFLPLYGLSSTAPYEGAWQGIFDTKNGLGHIMLISSLVFFLLCIDEKEFRWIKLALLILSLFLLVRSQSVASITITLSTFWLILLYKSLQWNFYLRATLLCLYIVAAIVTISWILENENLILQVMGRDSTLTGRNEIWETVIPIAEKRLLLGYGFNAFWFKGGEGESIKYILEWDTPHSHNGILDMWLEVGLIGVFTFGLSFLQAFYNSIKLLKIENAWNKLWPLIYLTQLALFNNTESALFGQNSIYWMLYVSIAISCYRQDSLRNTYGEKN